MTSRPFRSAASPKLPLPAKKSSRWSVGLECTFTNRSSTPSGFCVGYPVLSFPVGLTIVCLLGAAGAIEAGICALTIRDGIVAPTINYQHPDPDCDLDYVPNEARKVDVEVAMSNSFGFGGHNACLVLRLYRP